MLHQKVSASTLISNLYFLGLAWSSKTSSSWLWFELFNLDAQSPICIWSWWKVSSGFRRYQKLFRQCFGYHWSWLYRLFFVRSTNFVTDWRLILPDLHKLFYNSKLAELVFWILEIFVNLINSVIVFCLYLWQRTTCKNPSTHLKIFRTFFVIQDSALGVALVKLASDAPAGDFSAVGRPCDSCQAVFWRMRDLEFQGSAIHVPYVDL